MSGRPRTSVIKTVLKNPLIIATLLGLAVNCAGLKLPVPAETFLQHLGSASLAMGLLCIGAGLQWKAFKEELSLMAASSVQRLVAVPLVGWGRSKAVCLFSLRRFRWHSPVTS
ncbi:AEC family transporter [Duodenibacillus massiliensis]|uniref:AEC family transporter n=1 Tax=Duodenibacillus massiliensis TaxID=1852381 RepID=UPI00307A6BC1